MRPRVSSPFRCDRPGAASSDYFSPSAIIIAAETDILCAGAMSKIGPRSFQTMAQISFNQAHTYYSQINPGKSVE